MADIAAEIAWMRNRARTQATEDDAARARRDAEHRQRAARTCPFCFHDRHDTVYEMSGSPDPGSLLVFFCKDPICSCGVPPCMHCGERVRPTATDLLRRVCPMCRWEWRDSPIA